MTAPSSDIMATLRAAQHTAPQAVTRRDGAGAPVFKIGDTATDRRTATREQEAHLVAEQLVASTLVLPILSQARNDPFKSDMFHGGKGEEMFGSQLDTILAERITSSSRMPIVDAVYRSITRTSQPSAGAGRGVDLHG